MKFLIPPLPPTKFLNGDSPSFAWETWFQKVQNWLSNNGAPKTNTSPGVPLQIQGLETDGNYLYVAIGVNQWKRIPLSNF